MSCGLRFYKLVEDKARILFGVVLWCGSGGLEYFQAGSW
jgi:hypothetical protein